MASFDNKSQFDIYMSKYVGSLNEKDLDEIFQKHDKDGSGFIDTKELDGFINDIFIKEVSPDEIQQFKTLLLERIDYHNDGKLAKNELRAILPTEANFLLQFSNAGKTLCGFDFVKIWKHYDKNNNGSLEGSELEAFLQDLIMKTRPHTVRDQNFFKAVDVIKNSLIEEFGENTESLKITALAKYLKVEESCASFEGKSAEEFDKIFAKYDKDSSGEIEGDELSKLLADMYLNSDESDVDIIKEVVLLKLDKNQDNKLQKSELKEFLKIQE